MPDSTDILCIGSVLWDVIGRSASHMRTGSDVPGRITRLPGGVAMNIAMTLRRFDMTPTLLTAIGRDREGDELVAEARRMGLNCDHIYRSDDLPTDIYMAVEGANGLIAAIADAHSLEAAGAKVLTPLSDGPLGTPSAPFAGIIALDGNLTEDLLHHIANAAPFSAADLRVAPASPGKAERLLALMGHPSATLYVNREEAEIICKDRFASADQAATALMSRGAYRVLVTDGGNTAAEGTAGDVIIQRPPSVMVTRVTGAGDTFMAAHIASERQGMDRESALYRALTAAAAYVSGETPL